MSRKTDRLVMLAKQAGRGDMTGALHDIKRWAHSELVACGLRYDFEKYPEPPPPAAIPLKVLPLDGLLASKIFDPTGLNEIDRALLERRQAIWEAGFDGGYVAVADNGDPVYLQWMIPPSQQDRIHDYWGPLFDNLDSTTALAEGVWIPPQYRGQQIMAAASAMINDVVRHSAVEPFTHAIAFVASDNRGALKGFKDAGYEPHLARTERWRAGRRSVRFEPTGREYACIN